MYDSDGTILGIGYKKGSDPEKNYFFEKNAFVDVIAVYRNSDSVLIGTYEYDLWGNPVSAKEAAGGRDTDGILQKNPFRYRCYYYDTETGFYYLNSRYYDPQIRRFISADNQLAEIGASVIGYNLYAYCDNSPLGAVDYDGHFAITIAAGVTVSVGFILSVAAVGALTYMVYDYYQNPYNEQNPVAVLGNMLSDQIGSIRNAKKNKSGEKTGKGKTGTGGANKGITKPNKQTSPNQMQKQVESGQAPKEVDQVHSPHVSGDQPHIHFANHRPALNIDGTWKDGGGILPIITNKIAEWLIRNGWNLPKE